MSRKTSAYARRRGLNRNSPGGMAHAFNGVEWLNAIQRSRTYTSEAIPGAAPDMGGTDDAALKADVMVRDALNTLLGRAPRLASDEACEHVFDVLAHALGVAAIRAQQIQPDHAQNPALPVLAAGTVALQSAIERFNWRRAFGLDGAACQPLMDAVEVYADILNASSPAQMQAASDERLRILAKHAQTGEGAP